MSFDVAAESYDRFMGRYSTLLAPKFADFAGVRAGQRVLDVGCGPGALTAELVRRLGASSVAAVDPSEPFVAAARSRQPGVDVRRASAEHLPHADGSFDATLAQLVVHFMTDPLAGIREMARVTHAGGVVATCVWDHASERTPVSPFWRAARELDPAAEDEGRLTGAGVRAGHLAELFRAAGLDQVKDTELSVSLELTSFDDWWTPFTLGVGPIAAYVRKLSASQLAALRERCREHLGDGPFTVSGVAWTARGIVASAPHAR